MFGALWRIGLKGSTDGRACLLFRAKHSYPALNENDLEEKFVRSGGPGGQNVNKRSTCVQLRHVPTGVTVKCQEERTQESNRKTARKWLQERLDIHFNGLDSVVMRDKRDHQRKVDSHTNEARKRLAMKLAFKKKIAEDAVLAQSSKYSARNELPAANVETVSVETNLADRNPIDR